VISQYCNGSRVPPEAGGMGYQVPPGISDATVPNPIFSLTPAATVDEGNNWINISWGPLSPSNPLTGATLGNYAPAANSPIIDYVVCASTAGGCQGADAVGRAPMLDFFGNPRPDGSTSIDPGAVEHQNDSTGSLAPTLAAITPSSGLQGSRVSVVLTGTNLIGVTVPGGVNVSGGGVTATITAVNSNTISATFVIAAGAVPGARNVTVSAPSGTSNPVSFTVVAVSGTLMPNPVRFGAQATGTTSAPITVTFANTTPLPITLRSGTVGGLGNVNGPALGFTGGNAGNFAIVAGTTTCTNGATIGVGGTCVINVRFTPNAAGLRTTTLNIYVAGATTSFATDPVSGGGAIVSFSGTTALTSSPANRTAKSVLTTITNTGNLPLVISNISIAATGGTNRGTYTVANPGTLGTTACPIGGTGLAAGSACQVTVTYTPPAAGALNTITGTLTLTDTGALTPTQTRNYTGN